MIFSLLILEDMILKKCEGKRTVISHGNKNLLRTCGLNAVIECPSCDAPLCLKCSYLASRHREKCYGGKNIAKETLQNEIKKSL